MSDSDSECYDRFADAVVDVSAILVHPNITPNLSLKRNTNLKLTNDHRELLSRQLYDNLESSLKIKKTKSPNNTSIELQADDVTLFKASHIQESKANSGQALKEKPSKKRKTSSSGSDDDSENMEKFRMAAMTGEMLISARNAMSSGRQLTNSDLSNASTCPGRTEKHLSTHQSIKEG